MKKKDYLAVILSVLALGAAIFECWWLFAVLGGLSLFMTLFICVK